MLLLLTKQVTSYKEENERQKTKQAMEEALTDFPPPSRFFFEDLNNFSNPETLIPPPFLLFSNPNSLPLRPNLLLIAVSRPSCFLLHHIAGKTLIGTLVLPEFPAAGNSLEPSIHDSSCRIYALDRSPEIVLVSIQYPVTAERSPAVAKLLFDQIKPKKTLILASIQSRNYRGKLSPDEFLVFKLETLNQRLDQEGLQMVKDLDYFPSGSVIDGVAAAILAQCQIKMLKGTLLVSWPDFGSSVVLFLKSLLKDVYPGLDCDFDLESSPFREKSFDSELYT